MLDALVDRQDRQVAGAGQPAVADEPLEIRQHARVAVAGEIDAIDEVRAGQVSDSLGMPSQRWLSRDLASSPSRSMGDAMAGFSSME